MRLRWFHPLFVVCMLLTVGFAQNVSSTPVRDAQALDVLRKAVQAAGGLQAIDAFQSYLASGQIVFYSGEEKVEGEVTVKRLGLRAFRIDAQMPDGAQWWFIKDGKGFKKEPDGDIRPLLYQEVFNIQSYCSPMGQVAKALRDSSIEVFALRPSTRNGHSVVGVQVRRVSPLPTGTHGELSEKKYYFDSQTLQMVAIEDQSFPRDRIADGLKRTVTFSDYRDAGGVSVPFLIIDEVAHHRRLMEIHLKAVSVNAPINELDFQP